MVSDLQMSKDFRREKNDWDNGDNNDWVVGKNRKDSVSDKYSDDVSRRKRASKRLSRARDRQTDTH